MAYKPWPNGLRQRFLALWQRSLGPSTCGVAKVVQRLERSYAEPHRRYHTFEHIRFCLTQHDLAAQRMPLPDAVELAVWFHDAVHQPGSHSNEAASAAMFRHAAGAAAPLLVERVASMILDTTHDHKPTDQHGGFMVDIDLASLGRPWPNFIEDSRLLRQEQAGVPDQPYLIAQALFLEKLIHRPYLYRTPFFRLRYERRARANIARLLEKQAA